MTVQDNIPIPPPRKHGTKYAYVTADLVRPGQSKFAPCPEDQHIAVWQKRLSAQAAAKFGAGNYATRVVSEPVLEGCVEILKLGVRVWRTG